MSRPDINPEIKDDFINGNITQESDKQLFVGEDDISVIVSMENSVHLQMFEEHNTPDNLNRVVNKLDMLASSVFLDEINIKRDRPLVVHLNGKNIHFRTVGEIMCYVDGMLNMWNMLYDQLEDVAVAAAMQNEKAKE